MQLPFHFRQFFLFSSPLCSLDWPHKLKHKGRRLCENHVSFSPFNATITGNFHPERKTSKPTPQPRWMMNYDMALRLPEAIPSTSAPTNWTWTSPPTPTSNSCACNIGLEVLDEHAQDLWFDLVELTVDSVHING
jgi:hypothetical protein